MSLKEKFNSKFRIGKTEEPTNFVFDENSFDMKVEGGPTQSKPIKITAVLNVGEMKGKPLDLDCKWFNKTNSDIREIVGITGQTYQPCLSDVGTILHIQCVPSLPGKEYEGMPLNKQIGPLIVDTESEEEARQHVETSKATFFVNIVSFKLAEKESKPSEGFLKLQGNRLIVEVKNPDDSRSELVAMDMTEDYPNYVLNRINNRQVRVELSKDEQITLLAQDHLVRDVICLTSKMMIATKIVEKLNSEQSLTAPSSPPKRGISATADLLQLGELTKQNRQLSIEKEQLEKKYTMQRDQRQIAQQKHREIEERLQNLNRNYFTLEKQLEKLRQEKAKSQHHYTYVENEIKIVRAENLHLSVELQGMKKSVEYYTEKLKKFEQQQESKTYDQLEKELGQASKQVVSLNSLVSFLTAEKEKLEEASKLDLARIEQLQNEITYMEKKHALLASQKIEQLTNLDQSHELKMLEQRDKLREKEFLKMQDQIRMLIEQNNELRMLHSPTKSEKPGASKKPKKSEMVEVQKVANRLAQAIYEKDLMIQQQREVNKQLIERIAVLERKATEGEAPVAK